MPHIFVSYAKKDTRPLAEKLYRELNSVPSLTAWMDMSLEADSSWAMQIQDEIDRADYVVVLLSSDVNRRATPTQRRSFVLNEIDYAQQDNKPILPVMVHQTKQPVQIAGVQFIDLTRTPDNPTRVVEHICKRFNLPTPAELRQREATQQLRREQEAEARQRREMLHQTQQMKGLQKAAVQPDVKTPHSGGKGQPTGRVRNSFIGLAVVIALLAIILIALPPLMSSFSADTITETPTEAPTETSTPTTLATTETSTNTPTRTQPATATSAPEVDQPVVTILSPATDTYYSVDQEILVFVQATDSVGVTRMQLFANGQLVNSISSESVEGDTTFPGVLSFTPRSSGSYVLRVLAFRGDVSSEAAEIDIVVLVGSNCTVLTNVALNLRQEPTNIRDNIVQVLRAGETFPVIARLGDNSWYKISVSGTLGWVDGNDQFITLGGDCSTVPVETDNSESSR